MLLSLRAIEPSVEHVGRLAPVTVLTSRFDEALVYASRLHDGQTRKGSGTPYIGHLLAVAAIVLEHGGTEDEAIAALLHDAVEDQGGGATREAIRRRFGAAVVAIVDGCTDTDQTPKPPWRQRKEAHLAHLREAAPSVRLVAAADKLHNARSVLADYREHGEAIWGHFRGGRAGTLWYYRAMTDALADAGPTPLSAELDRAVGELERLADGEPASDRAE
jgi:GTP pyrophosphokinase